MPCVVVGSDGAMLFRAESDFTVRSLQQTCFGCILDASAPALHCWITESLSELAYSYSAQEIPTA